MSPDQYRKHREQLGLTQAGAASALEIVPCDALRSIKREETVSYKPSFADPTRSFSERTTRYTMDFSETF